MLRQRRRRWRNIEPDLGQYLLFAGSALQIITCNLALTCELELGLLTPQKSNAMGKQR